MINYGGIYIRSVKERLIHEKYIPAMKEMALALSKHGEDVAKYNRIIEEGSKTVEWLKQVHKGSIEARISFLKSINWSDMREGK